MQRRSPVRLTIQLIGAGRHEEPQLRATRGCPKKDLLPPHRGPTLSDVWAPPKMPPPLRSAFRLFVWRFSEPDLWTSRISIFLWRPVRSSLSELTSSRRPGFHRGGLALCDSLVRGLI